MCFPTPATVGIVGGGKKIVLPQASSWQTQDISYENFVKREYHIVEPAAIV